MPRTKTDFNAILGSRIPLSKNMFALVDDCDLDRIAIFKWSVSICRRGAYAVRHGLRKNGTWGPIYMHREVMGAPDGLLVDHRSTDGLDNRRSNLRLGTRSNNQHNRMAGAGSSRFKGVSWHRGGSKWQVHIEAHDVRRYLGLFADEIEAALAYDAAARRLHGAVARLNFPAAGESSALAPAEIGEAA